MTGGVAERLKAARLRRVPVGVPGFDSPPRHSRYKVKHKPDITGNVDKTDMVVIWPL